MILQPISTWHIMNSFIEVKYIYVIILKMINWKLIHLKLKIILQA